MKNKISLLLVSILSVFTTYAQENVTLEYNELKTVKFTVFEIPLRINQVAAQSSIDYSNPQGLIQSYYSANSVEWAMSDYLEKPESIARDAIHFEAVKKRDTKTDYAQLESLYEFEYNTRSFCYVKFSAIMKELPFPLMMLLSLEKKDGRWYISQLLNQSQVSKILLNFDQSILTTFFSGKDKVGADLIKTADPFTTNQFSFAKMDKLFSNAVVGSKQEVLDKIQDKRILGEGSMGVKASVDSKPKLYNFDIQHPFLIDSSSYIEYSGIDNVIVSSPENMALWAGKPESILANEASKVRLISNFSFYSDNEKFSILTYFSSKKATAVVMNENGAFKKELTKYQDFKNLFQNFKKNVLLELVQTEGSNKNVDRIRKASSASDKVLNLSLLVDFLEKNPKEKQFVFE